MELKELNDLHDNCTKISANYRYIVSIEGKETSAVVSLFVFLGLPQMQSACITLCSDVGEKLIIGRGCLNLLCTFPGGHWIRANIQCCHSKVVCLFKQETSKVARWPLWKRHRNTTTRHTLIGINISRVLIFAVIELTTFRGCLCSRICQIKIFRRY